MSPSDLGEILKPFVFLDLFDHEGPPFEGPLHPHSGIATVTYVTEGAISYIDPANVRGVLPAGGVEWMQAGRGMWHGGGLDKAGRTRGFQLWLALPPALELGQTISIYQAPDEVPQSGPARVLLGAIGSGALSAPGELRHGDLAAFEPSSKAVEFEALTDAEFMLGSAAPHDHDLVLGYYSVHTSSDALRDGEAHISAIRQRHVQEDRLQGRVLPGAGYQPPTSSASSQSCTGFGSHHALVGNTTRQPAADLDALDPARPVAPEGQRPIAGR
jgi:hypothetical protein